MAVVCNCRAVFESKMKAYMEEHADENPTLGQVFKACSSSGEGPNKNCSASSTCGQRAAEIWRENGGRKKRM